MSDRAVDFLEEILITSAGELQKAAVAVLGWVGRESSIKKLLALLKEEDLEEPMLHALKKIEVAQNRPFARAIFATTTRW